MLKVVFKTHKKCETFQLFGSLVQNEPELVFSQAPRFDPNTVDRFGNSESKLAFESSGWM